MSQATRPGEKKCVATTLLMFPTRNYRGSTVEDLEITPAVSINPGTPLSEALEIAYENDFTFLPVINHVNRKLLGVFEVDKARKSLHDQGSLPNPYTGNYMRWFHHKARDSWSQQHPDSQGDAHRTTLTATIMRPRGSVYRVLTPSTPLEELTEFFNTGEDFAIITNPRGTFVYGVATPDDLLRYQKLRPNL